MFNHSNTSLLPSAAIERFFSVGKDVLKPKRGGLTDQHFEMLVFFKRSMQPINGVLIFYRQLRPAFIF